MYNLNTRNGKKQRVAEIKGLIKKLSILTPTDDMSLNDIESIISYLIDVKQDIEGQLFTDELKQARELRKQSRR